jgi:hypothetical protein
MSVIGSKPRVGRVQLAIRRCFVAAGGQPLTIPDFLAFAFPPGQYQAQRFRDAKWEAQIAWRKFCASLQALPPHEAAPLWQAAQAQAVAALGDERRGHPAKPLACFGAGCLPRRTVGDAY